jgi:hypothetical protein
VRFLISGITRQGMGLSLGLVLLAAASLTACSQNEGSSQSVVDQKVETMMGKMGVPGASSTPSKTAMTLDCPPIKTMLEEVRTAPASISPASRQALNAWARWCNLKQLPEQAS